MHIALLALALVVTGTLVGVELMVAAIAAPLFSRLPGETGLLARADSARVMGRLMPWWYAGAILLVLLSALTAEGTDRTVLVGASGAFLVVGIVLSIVLLVPINNRVRTWDRDERGAPSDWRAQLSRWDGWHVGRVGVFFTGFVLLAVAAVI
ncbi:DUF1772 domain-containing protein [Brachybacterium sp. MASK1Z-5]|uniref:DUF1772 domain-containing protein n=1 Tax=Brachybacterium halotolerans TaxID=2795215 RepID=A0ABS1BD23_9MICO|nr:DUF1772 domain-containing protein [Brachybacterium halotolerans]MBK0332551.1 DUF1772 domain-containing protein [Brachybacterium halotolerans]